MDTLDVKYKKRTNLFENEEERHNFLQTIAAFVHYEMFSLRKVHKNENYFSRLSIYHQVYLSNYQVHLQNVKFCIKQNADIIQMFIRDAYTMFENIIPDKDLKNTHASPVPSDLEKIHATIMQLVRDWTILGIEEREACYQPIIDEIVDQFPPNKCDPSKINVLVPGAGLGRLAFEIARRGYICQGNEYSLFMLLASHFVLNRCRQANLYKIYPWVHQYTNNLCSSHQTQDVLFPDVDPSNIPPTSQFSIAAGDFLETYQEDDQWNCIATCFFIDCTNNIADVIERIYKSLKPNGIWINLGPLLYHYSDTLTEDSIEPSYEVLKQFILHLGFTIEKENTQVKTRYAQNINSMLQREYNCVYFVCKKSNLPHKTQKTIPKAIFKTTPKTTFATTSSLPDHCFDLSAHFQLRKYTKKVSKKDIKKHSKKDSKKHIKNDSTNDGDRDSDSSSDSDSDDSNNHDTQEKAT